MIWQNITAYAIVIACVIFVVLRLRKPADKGCSCEKPGGCCGGGGCTCGK